MRGASDVNAEDSEGWRPLHSAVISGDQLLVEDLITRGADVNLPRGRSYTTLIQYAPDAYRPYGSSPLHLAALKKDVAVVQLLLSHGAAVNQTDNNRLTALHVCAMEGSVEVARVLVDAGADVSADSENGTPLEIAGNRSMREMVEYLIASGTKHDVFTAAESDDVEALSRLLDELPESLSSRRDGWTPLHCAADRGALRAAEHLIQRGAEVDAIEGDEDTVDDYDGYTPLFLSVARGNSEMAALLLRSGADPNASSRTGDSLLYLTVLWDRAEIVRLLLQSGGTDNNGTALTLARESNSRRPNGSRILEMLSAGKARSSQELPPLGSYPRILTPEGRRIVLTRAGPAYVALLQWIRKHNGNLPQAEIDAGLQELLGPSQVEHLFAEPRSLQYVPDYLYPTEGQQISFLEVQPLVMMECMIHFNATRAAMRKNFGNVEAVLRLRAAHVAEGGKAGDFDAFIDGLMCHVRQEWEAVVEQARIKASND